MWICSFHETLLVPVLMLWKEKERSRVRAIQMDNLRGLLGIRRMDMSLNAWIGELFRVKNFLDESMLQWFGHLDRMA